MSTESWRILLGAIVFVLLALVPWMLMVHAKLAVLAAQVARLTSTVDRLIETDATRRDTAACDHVQLAELRRQVDRQQKQMEHFGRLLQEYGE